MPEKERQIELKTPKEAIFSWSKSIVGQSHKAKLLCNRRVIDEGVLEL